MCGLWSEKGVTMLDMYISYQNCHRLSVIHGENTEAGRLPVACAAL